MSKLLSKLVNEGFARMAQRGKRFISPGTTGRRYPWLQLTGELAGAVADVQPGTKVKLVIHGTVVGGTTIGQKDHVTVEVHEAYRTR
jgi:hypothetical protein